MGLDINIYRVKRTELSKEAQDDYSGVVAMNEIRNSEEIYGDSLAYFRKANFLFSYFENDMNDELTMAVLDKYAVEDIIELCKEVLNVHTKAEELLPTTDGFFFGSIEYDDLYFEKVQDVLNQFEEVLKEYNSDRYFYYIDFWY